MEIRQYGKADGTFLFDLLISEESDWIDYYGPVGRSKKKHLNQASDISLMM